MATVRLDIRTEVALKRLTARRGQTKSEVIRDAIDHLVEEEEKQTSAYERLKPFVGIIEGGDPKLSENTGKRFRELLENRQCAQFWLIQVLWLPQPRRGGSISLGRQPQVDAEKYPALKGRQQTSSVHAAVAPSGLLEL